MKRVFSSFNLQLVHNAKNILAAHGVRAVVKNEILSSAMGELPPAECQAELWVKAADAPRAERILFCGETRDADWTCGCGETLGGQFTQCWSCGSYRA